MTVEYDDNKPVRVDTIVISSQHHPDITQERIQRDLIEQVDIPTVPAALLVAE